MERMEAEAGHFAKEPAADLWHRTLNQIPTTFGRLAYLSSLRNVNSGAYEHHGLGRIFGPEEAGRTLLESHRQVFAEWLCLTLERQKEELAGYLDGLEEEARRVLESWLRLTPYRNFLPVGAREGERELYLADMETASKMLRRERDVAAPDPDA